MPFQDFIEDGPRFQNPIAGAASEFAQESPSTSALFGNEVTSGFTRKAGSFLAENIVHGADVASDNLGLDLPNTQKISADQVNASAPIGNDGKPTHITDDPMYENVANMLIKDKQRELVNDNMTSRYSNAHGMLPTFAVGAASFMADPSNLAMTSYGGAVLGGSKVLAGLGALGVDTATTAARVGARVVSGAAGGAASMVPLAGAQLGISKYQGGDYDLHSALNDLAFGAVGGALLHGIGGSALHESGLLKPDELMKSQNLRDNFQAQASDILRQPAPVKAAAINSTIADVINGRPADPESVIGRGGQPPDVSQVADDRASQNQNGYSPNMTPEEIAVARQTILPNGLKVEPKFSRLPDEEIDRYKETVQTALQNAGITNVDDSVVREIARIKAEQINPEAAVKPRSAADVAAGKLNPEPVWKSVDVTPKSVEVAPRAVPVAELKLPSELSKSSPRWAGGKEVYFDSDVDKALYIVGGKGKSPSHDKFVSFLTDKAGLTKQQIAQGALDVRDAIKENAKEKTEVINVPKVFNSDKPIERTVPNKRSITPFKNPNVLQLAAEMGGLKEEGAELKAMDADKIFVPGRGRLVRETGVSLDKLGQALEDRGYVKERPTKAEVLEIIRDGINGKHLYSESSRGEIEEKIGKAKQNQYHEDLERHAGEMGIDTTGMKPEEILAELEKQTRASADEHNALDLLDQEDSSLQKDYYPDMEEDHANETIPLSAYEGHESEVRAGNERSESETRNERSVQGAEQVNAGLLGRGTEGEGANGGRAATNFEPAKNITGGGEQGILGGMEQSAKQAAAARGEKIRSGVEQKPANEGLFASVIGGGDELDLRIADAERTINASGMTVEERADLQQSYKEAYDTDKIYSDKLKELGECLSENGV